MPDRKTTLGSAPQSGRAEARSTPDGDYEVGYRKPPKEHRFQKGKSGNPKGRPKKVQTESIDISSIIHEEVAVRRNGKTVWMEAYEASLRKLAERALKNGNVSAGIKFVRICEKHGVIKKAPTPHSGGVLIVDEDECAERDERDKHESEQKTR